MFIQFYYLLPQRLHSETSDGFRTKLSFTNTMYTFSFFQQFCFKVSSLYKRHTVPHTPIYRAFKLTNSYLQIYLVKP